MPCSQVTIGLRIDVNPHFRARSFNRSLHLGRRSRYQHSGRNLSAGHHQRSRGDHAARADYRSVEDRRVVGDQSLRPDVDAVDHTQVRHCRPRADVYRDAGRCV